MPRGKKRVVLNGLTGNVQRDSARTTLTEVLSYENGALPSQPPHCYLSLEGLEEHEDLSPQFINNRAQTMGELVADVQHQSTALKTESEADIFKKKSELSEKRRLHMIRVHEQKKSFAMSKILSVALTD